MLPLGGLTKAQVREPPRRAAWPSPTSPTATTSASSPTATPPASCAHRLGPQPGPVVDALTGAVVGRHDGAYAFTVGQRRGLALSAPAADGRPRYVLGLEPVTPTVTVGPREALDVTQVRADRPRALVPLRAAARLRGAAAGPRPAPRACTVARDADGWRIELAAPAPRPAAGQAAVLYDGDRVLGSATVGG